jgi:hypothetical protein
MEDMVIHRYLLYYNFQHQEPLTLVLLKSGYVNTNIIRQH